MPKMALPKYKGETCNFCTEQQNKTVNVANKASS